MSSELFQDHYPNFQEDDWPSPLESISLNKDYFVVPSGVALSPPVWDGCLHHANANAFSSVSSSSSSLPGQDFTKIMLAGMDPFRAPSLTLQDVVASVADVIPNYDARRPFISSSEMHTISSSCHPVCGEDHLVADAENGLLIADRASRRKRQNRASQRRFRANRIAKIKDSQERVNLLEAHLDIQRERNVMLEQEWLRMKKEVDRLTLLSHRH